MCVGIRTSIKTALERLTCCECCNWDRLEESLVLSKSLTGLSSCVNYNEASSNRQATGTTIGANNKRSDA